MKFVIAPSLLVAAFGFLAAADADAVLIDPFDVAQTLSIPADSFSTSVVNGGTILGGQREIALQSGPGTGLVSVDIGNIGGSDRLTYSQDDLSGLGYFAWDGPDGSVLLDPTGLGGIDLTDAGFSDAFLLDVVAQSLTTTLTLTVYTDASNSSDLTIAIPAAPPHQETILFGDFSVVSGGGADFSNVGAIVLTLDGPNNVDFQFENFRSANGAPIPEPGSLSLVATGMLFIAARRRGARRHSSAALR